MGSQVNALPIYLGGTGKTNASDALAALGGTTNANLVYGEVPAGTIGSGNVTFTLAFAPNPASTLRIFLAGLRMAAGIDYTLSSNVITMAEAPTNGPILADYQHV